MKTTVYIPQANVMRVYNIAKVLGLDSKATLQRLHQYGILWPRSASSALSVDDAFTFMEWTRH
jgi:hypothetical protein